jgi:hypothetical protein
MIRYAQLMLWGLLGFSAAAQPPTIGNCTVLPADSIWNTPIDQLPVSANSATWVNTIGSAKPVHPDFGSGTYNGAPIGIPFVTVPGTQTKYPATFTYADESDPGPYAIPLNAPIEGGSQSTGDRHAIAIDTDNCILYELYAAYPQTASWTAGSGAIFNLFSDALRPSGWTSADAAGLAIFPGLLRYDEVASGEIRHAIRFTVPQTRNSFVWPARHYASALTGSQYPPMGARFRLKASFDISGYSATNQVILRALQKYGMMIADNGSSWYISGAPDSRWNNDDLHLLTQILGSNFEGVDVSGLMVDPNSGQAYQSTPPAPVLSAVAPHSGVQGTSVQATLTGSNFQSGATVAMGGTGVTASNVAVVSSTQITAVFTIAASAATGARSVTVTTAAGTSAPQSFTVTAATASGPPTLTSLNPNSGSRGTVISVTVSGTNFTSPASVTVQNGGVTVSNVVVVNSTTIRASFHISKSASRHSSNTTVTTAAGVSNALPFTVH